MGPRLKHILDPLRFFPDAAEKRASKEREAELVRSLLEQHGSSSSSSSGGSGSSWGRASGGEDAGGVGWEAGALVRGGNREGPEGDQPLGSARLRTQWQHQQQERRLHRALDESLSGLGGSSPLPLPSPPLSSSTSSSSPPLAPEEEEPPRPPPRPWYDALEEELTRRFAERPPPSSSFPQFPRMGDTSGWRPVGSRGEELGAAGASDGGERAPPEEGSRGKEQGAAGVGDGGWAPPEEGAAGASNGPFSPPPFSPSLSSAPGEVGTSSTSSSTSSTSSSTSAGSDSSTGSNSNGSGTAGGGRSFPKRDDPHLWEFDERTEGAEVLQMTAWGQPWALAIREPPPTSKFPSSPSSSSSSSPSEENRENLHSASSSSSSLRSKLRSARDRLSRAAPLIGSLGGDDGPGRPGARRVKIYMQGRLVAAIKDDALLDDEGERWGGPAGFPRRHCHSGWREAEPVSPTLYTHRHTHTYSQ
jgi:hypothetical protein